MELKGIGWVIGGADARYICLSQQIPAGKIRRTQHLTAFVVDFFCGIRIEALVGDAERSF